MRRLGYRTGGRTRGAGAAALVTVALAAASVLLASPAGASNQTVTFEVTSINFGSVVIGTSATEAAIVTNTSAFPIYFLAASPGTGAKGAEYHASQGTCTTALAPGSSCDVDVAFAPTEATLRASTLTVRFGEENAKGKVIAAANEGAALSGRGVKPTFSLSGGSAGDIPVGQIGTADVQVTNTSPVPLTPFGAHLQGVKDKDFAISSTTCPAPILPGGSCDIVLVFRPHHTGSASVTLTASMFVQGTKGSFVAKQITVTGSGVLVGKEQPFTLSALDFGSVTVGTSASGDVVLTNTSANSEILDSASLSNDGSGAYAIVGNTCGSSIASGASCDLEVTYAPEAAVVHNATLVAHVTYLNSKLVKVVGSSQASLTGQGVAPTFALHSNGFPGTTVGASSQGTVTITNTSLVPLTYSSASFQGADAASWSLAGSSCTGAIEPDESCNVAVNFTPRDQGELSITLVVDLQLTVRSHTSNWQQRVALDGEGNLPSFAVDAPTLASTPKGVAVTGSATVTNDSNVSLSYDGYSFTGSNANDFTVIGGTCTGATIAPSASCALTVQFTPSISSAGSESATLKVIMLIPGTSPAITTSNSVSVSGEES